MVKKLSFSFLNVQILLNAMEDKKGGIDATGKTKETVEYFVFGLCVCFFCMGDCFLVRISFMIWQEIHYYF